MSTDQAVIEPPQDESLMETENTSEMTAEEIAEVSEKIAEAVAEAQAEFQEKAEFGKICVEAARLNAAHSWPYAGVAIMSMVPVMSMGMPAMAIDKHWRLYWNPLFAADTPRKQLVAVILHEFGHVIRGHFQRFINIAGYDPTEIEEFQDEHFVNAYRWNVATDCAINDDLDTEGWPIEDVLRQEGEESGCCLPESFGLPRGHGEEYYYVHLKQQEEQAKEKAKEQGQGKPGGQSGQGQPGQGQPGEGEGKGELRDLSKEERWPAMLKANEDARKEAQKQAREGGGVSGMPGSSGVDGIQRDFEADANGSRPGDPNHPKGTAGAIPKGISEADAKRKAKEVAKKIGEAVRKGRGTVPAGMQRWADEINNPKVPWQRVLRRVVAKSCARIAGASDYTFAKLPRRESPRKDIITSSPFARQVKSRVVIDTSGSMCKDDLASALGEITGILRASPAREGLEVISCDAQLYDAQKIHSVRKIKLQGGGGTSMELPIEAARTERKASRPDILIILTDGYTPWPATPVPGMTVVAALTRADCGDPPAWIKSVYIDNKELT